MVGRFKPIPHHAMGNPKQWGSKEHLLVFKNINRNCKWIHHHHHYWTASLAYPKLPPHPTS